MTLTTTLIATPDPDHDAETGTCPQDVNFCEGACIEYGDGYHHSGFTWLDVRRPLGLKKGTKAELTVSVFRQDTKKKIGKPRIAVLTGACGDEFTVGPAKARRLAAMLLNAADSADPLPLGVVIVEAHTVRIDDELLTADGWQTVTGLLVFKDSQVGIFTPERNDEDSDGWPFGYNDFVPVRRALNDGVAWMSAVAR
jgi:hypothetical protein